MTALRPMQLDAPVGRPETALDSGGWSGAEILGGVAAVVLIPLIVASIIVFLYLGSIVGAAVLTILALVAVAILAALTDEASLALTIVAGAAALMLIPAVILGLMIVLVLISDTVAEIGASAIDEADREQLLEEEDVIEARFVQLGRDFEDELPNREVPLLDTAPQELAQVPTEDTPDEPPEEIERPEERPPDAVEDDILRDVLNRSRVFAEIGEEREREGSPDGIEEGTEREATEGNVYRGRLYSFFRRGWTIPTTLDRDLIQDLSVTVRIQIGQNLEIVSFEIQRESGNPLFDGSVTEQLTRLQATGQHIPPPPEEVADQYIGATIAVRFHGRQAG